MKPKNKPRPRRTPVQIRFGEQLLARLDAVVNQRGTTRAALVIGVLAEWLEAREKKAAL